MREQREKERGEKEREGGEESVDMVKVFSLERGEGRGVEVEDTVAMEYNLASLVWNFVGVLRLCLIINVKA